MVMLFQLILSASVASATLVGWNQGIDRGSEADLPAPTPEPTDALRIGPAYSPPDLGVSGVRTLGSRLDYRQESCYDGLHVASCPITDPHCCPISAPYCCSALITVCCQANSVCCLLGYCCSSGSTCCGVNNCCASGYICSYGQCVRPVDPAQSYQSVQSLQSIRSIESRAERSRASVQSIRSIQSVESVQGVAQQSRASVASVASVASHQQQQQSEQAAESQISIASVNSIASVSLLSVQSMQSLASLAHTTIPTPEPASNTDGGTSTTLEANNFAATTSSNHRGAIIGGAVGGTIGGLALIALLAFYFVRRKQRQAEADEVAAASNRMSSSQMATSMPSTSPLPSPMMKTAAESYYTTPPVTVPAMVYDHPSNGTYDPTALGQGHVVSQYGRPTSDGSGNGLAMWVQRPDSVANPSASSDDPIAYHPSQAQGVNQATTSLYPKSAAMFYGPASPPPAKVADLNAKDEKEKFV